VSGIVKTAAGFLITGALVLALGACSRGETLDCSGGSMYRDAQSGGPLQVPDDLTVPDETEALRVPATQPSASEDGSDTCLEYSPSMTRQR
jgi:uncharacterized lipoprotein